MDYRKLSVETWGTLDDQGSPDRGYRGVWLSSQDNSVSQIHIFRDNKDHFHFVVEVEKNEMRNLDGLQLNGLEISLSGYKLNDRIVRTVIDLRCKQPTFLSEFTEVVKEISRHILDGKLHPFDAVNRTVRKWMIFWSVSKQLLTEEQQIGLICELKILQELAQLDPQFALNSWTGPLGHRHDFVFSKWSVEAKGTRNLNRVHTINGLDQLKSLPNRELLFVSMIFDRSVEEDDFTLPVIIDQTIDRCFCNNPELIIEFFELLAKSGYNPLFETQYSSSRFQLLESLLFVVNEFFPVLTSDSLITELDNRISAVKYNISLSNLTGVPLSEVDWSQYVNDSDLMFSNGF